MAIHETAIPTRAPASTSEDDTILPFSVEALELRGRVVRFGPAIDTILSQDRYPAPVAKLLGEAIVLTVLLGSTLKFDGSGCDETQGLHYPDLFGQRWVWIKKRN